MKFKFDNKRLYFDGGFGSRVMAAGYVPGPALNITAPDAVAAVHVSYLEAGADFVTANTFSCNRLKSENFREEILAGVRIAKRCAARYDGTYTVYDCGPLGELLEPLGTMPFDKAYELFKEQAEAVRETKADIVLIETFTDLAELKAAVLAFKENTSLPIFCSMSFEENGRTFTGCSAAAFALTAEALGVNAVGINCGLGPDKLIFAVSEIKRHTTLPVFVQPNAGLPRYVGGKSVYDMDAESFSSYMGEIAAAGADILGGCCGTEAAHIKLTVQKTYDIPLKRTDKVDVAACSASRVQPLNATVTVGERVNPTGKPMLKRALTEGDYDYVLTMCFEQAAEGAQILDLNAGMPGIDEAAVLSDIIKNVQSVQDLPLQIDTTRAEALACALRVTAGVPIINSVNAEDASLNAVLPLAKKYGCPLICLPLDENGIPETAAGRMALVRKIAARAKKEGIPKEKLIVDGLVMAVSVNPDNPKITIDTVRAATRAGFRTALGLSNVSFGLPAREVLNAAFYEAAKKAGLTLAIINPKTKPFTVKAARDALTKKDEGFKEFLEQYAGENAKRVETAREDTLKGCIVKGLKNDALQLARNATADNYLEVINKEVVPALETVGVLYEQGKAFLPQLISSSEAAKAVLDYIKCEFMQNQADDGIPMLILTVKGDVHDIGKNIVKAVLGNYGFRITDLGKNVGTEEVMSAAESLKPRVIGLSALMTTTLDGMKETVEAIKAKYPETVVAVGGAVVTESFAKKIGADVYGKDAMDTVRKLTAIFR
ncbi:MAG: homocysteine S-methyltransferase family protein [Clostridiaceae bacterium]|jgi:5-methyltetrahydrofolate--homocysteine methyltransferase|nr:homocysteine S-methyltransferase family protein [Clostridiaceae bacterium]